MTTINVEDLKKGQVVSYDFTGTVKSVATTSDRSYIVLTKGEKLHLAKGSVFTIPEAATQQQVDEFALDLYNAIFAGEAVQPLGADTIWVERMRRAAVHVLNGPGGGPWTLR